MRFVTFVAITELSMDLRAQFYESSVRIVAGIHRCGAGKAWHADESRRYDIPFSVGDLAVENRLSLAGNAPEEAR